MNTRKFAIAWHLFLSSILCALIYFSLGARWPLSAQTSETHPTATETSEPSPQATTKDVSKIKHAAGSYSVDQAPEHDVPAKSEELRLLREQNRRLKAENAQLQAELAALKAKK
jgi:hypothetical protein